MTKLTDQVALTVTKEFTDRGKLIEAGFAAFRHLVIPNATPAEVAEFQLTFMAGAEHLFTSILAIMDPGDEEPTDDDMKRMDLIHRELEGWRGKLFDRLHGGPQGRAS